ncbi:MAG: hypothetical protein MUF49_00565 [Oculatellaceae cyanobacterium Prado106]|jgi:hypothetical protein|nr:hypothetical protein [Oculatellaceae cyanobacterium Prado106]
MNAIVIIETHGGGHHLMYLRVISKILLESGYSVLVFYPEPEQVMGWMAIACPESLHRFKVLPAVEPRTLRPRFGKLPQPLQVLARWQAAAQMAKIARKVLGQSPELFLFNWLDDLFSAYLPHALIDRLFPYPWAGLCFQPRWQRERGWLDHHEALNARHCRGCGVLDMDMAQQLQQRVRTPVLSFPDFTDETAPDPNFAWVEQIREQAQGRKIVALLGSLHRRKGLLTCIDVALRSPSEPYFFVFAGKLSPYTLSANDQAHIRAIAANPPANCFFRLEPIPDEPQFNALVNASDILFAAYEDFPYSSNLLTKAAVFQKPVIVSEGFCLGERVQQFSLGVAIAGQGTEKVDRCMAALHTLCQEPALPHNFAEYHQRHSIAQLHLALQEMLSHV